MEYLLNIARAIRLWLFKFTSFSLFGLELDVLLHFGFGFLLFGVMQRHLGTRRAAQLLTAMIILKEVADIFLKSQLAYIKHPTHEMVWDISLDLLTGALGGLAAWYWARRRATRAGRPAIS